MKTDRTLDGKGLLQSMLMERVKDAIAALKPSEILEVIATDHSSLGEIRKWTESEGHELVDIVDDWLLIRLYIKKAQRS